MASTAKPNGVNGHLNGTSDEDFHTLVRHPHYYIQSADLFFLLRNVLFRVHRYFFERESAWYRAKLAHPSSPGAAKCGSSENEPIVFTDVSPADFEKFLWVFYNPRFSLYAAPASTWTSILSLAHKWGFAEVKAFCVRELEKKSVEELEDIDRIVVYHANDVDRNLLIPVYAALCARERPLTLPEGLKLGMETTLVIASAREYVRSKVMEDGSRTPITPTVEDEEMEKIIRDFFGIPIPASSSTSADDVPATAAMADPVDTAKDLEEQEKVPKLKLKVKPNKDEDESSDANYTPTVTASATVAAAAKSIANGDTFGVNDSPAHEEGAKGEAAGSADNGEATSADANIPNTDGASAIERTPSRDADEDAAGANEDASGEAPRSRSESPISRLKVDTGNRPRNSTIGRGRRGGKRK